MHTHKLNSKNSLLNDQLQYKYINQCAFNTQIIVNFSIDFVDFDRSFFAFK